MFLDPANLPNLPNGLNILEEIEKASMRLVVWALVELAQEAEQVFDTDPDKADTIAEDLTREALDSMGVSGKRIRVAGTIDYKRARLIFHPEYAICQALLVDAKAEKDSKKARIQTSQTSLRIMRRTKQGAVVDEQGTLPQIVTMNEHSHATTTIFAKFFYEDPNKQRNLKMIRVACLPNRMLQQRYNPDADDTIWSAGPHSPKRKEKFRTRLNFKLLKQKAGWRVQDIHLVPKRPFEWSE